MTLPARVRLVEVGPRDGLQNEDAALPVPVKAELIERLAASGLAHIEAGAFVSPKAIPQMADSDAVLAALPDLPGVRLAALVPNEQGMHAALQTRISEVAVFAAASETFSKRNINCTIDESYARFEPVIALAKQAGLPVRGYVSCVMGCPYEGRVSADRVAEVAGQLHAMGCYEISLGDTIGVGVAPRFAALIERVAREVPIAALAVHCHDTFGQALANIAAALEAGIAVVDSSVAGLGGCPYAEGATGNVATEDVVYFLEQSGVKTGVDLRALVETAWWISDRLGREPQSRVARALAAKAKRTKGGER